LEKRVDVMLHLDRASAVPLWRQVYAQMRDAILAGTLRSEERLPSSRELAASLGVSRNLVLAAYAQLVAEGYLESRPQSGMIVAAGLDSVAVLAPSPPHPSATALVEADIIDFRPGLPALEYVPRQQWGWMMQMVCRETVPARWGYGSAEGDAEIREVLCRHLARVRGLRATPGQVVMTTGAAQAFTLLAQCWLRPTDRVLVEDPMSADIRRRYAARDVQFVPVPVDAQGLMVEAIPAGRAPRLIHVTPSHQFPLGGVLSIGRRLALVRLAQSCDGLIVEDDYDSEFRYSGAPIPALQGLAPEQVAYVGTMSKTLSPALRMGYLIVPHRLIAAARAAKREFDLHSSRLDLLTLARFIEEGLFERHLATVKRVYRQRREVMLSALARLAPRPYLVKGDSTGLHLVVSWPGRRYSAEWVEETARRGVRVYRVEQHALVAGQHEMELILGYGHLRPEQITTGIERLATAIAGLGAERTNQNEQPG
jgi:GntR family transcriptional regulator/MocR family aminotransferase